MVLRYQKKMWTTRFNVINNLTRNCTIARSLEMQWKSWSHHLLIINLKPTFLFGYIWFIDKHSPTPVIFSVFSSTHYIFKYYKSVNFFDRLSFMNLVHLGGNPKWRARSFLKFTILNIINSIDLTRPYHIPKWHIWWFLYIVSFVFVFWISWFSSW